MKTCVGLTFVLLAWTGWVYGSPLKLQIISSIQITPDQPAPEMPEWIDGLTGQSKQQAIEAWLRSFSEKSLNEEFDSLNYNVKFKFILDNPSGWFLKHHSTEVER